MSGVVWKVYFQGSFWGHQSRDHAGKEIPMETKFQWGDTYWYVPAVYTCARGLVVDLCCQVPAGRVQAFLDKWEPVTAEGRELTPEERMTLDLENPLDVAMDSELTLNGRRLRSTHVCGLCWNPCVPEDGDRPMRAAMEHYALDPKTGWILQRHMFPRGTKRRPELKNLSLTLRKRPARIPGPRFCVSAPGDTVRFSHGQAEHTLTVQDYRRKVLEKTALLPGQLLPNHYTVMTYTVEPELPNCEVTVCDCGDSDQPRWRIEDAVEQEAAAIGIIGGADGPTAIILGQPEPEGGVHTACSALHFTPVEAVQWRLVFQERRAEEITVTLR